MDNFVVFLRKVDMIINKVAQIDANGYCEKEDVKRECLDQLKEMITKQRGTFTKQQLNSVEFDLVVSKSQRLYNEYYSYIETAACLRALTSSSKNSDLNSNNNALGERELEAMNLTDKSHLVFIGSGPFPWSALKYHTSSGCKVTCIEIKPEPVYLSHQFFKKLGVDGSFRILCRDATTVDYKNATHTVLAAMVAPKKRIINQIVNTVKSGTMIVVRSSFGLNSFFYQKYSPHKIPYLRLIKTVYGDDKSELMSYIFKVVK